MSNSAPGECNIDAERGVAVHVLRILIDLLGDPTTMTVDLWQLHRIILAMRSVVVEADQNLSSDADFVRVAQALAPMIAEESIHAREFRLKNGIGLMDLVLQIDGAIH